MNKLTENKHITLLVLCCIFCLGCFQSAFASTPVLNYSDLISGPDTGLGDGLGSGVIVTVWGQNLGHSQGSSRVSFTDSSGTERNAAHVYYWKNADGQLPSGPANLYASHDMQEIAFSIPDSATGAGTIKVTVNGQDSNTLPFTVRNGNIYHVTSGGNDADNGSFATPWRTTQEIIDSAPSGSTTYVHDVDTGSSSSTRAFYWNTGSSSSSLAEQFALISYPGHHPKFTAQKAIETYNVDALVVSKLDIYASNYSSVDSNDQPTGLIAIGATYGIQASKHGRAIGNRVGDIPGGCASKYQGAIVGGANFYDKVSLYKMFGNEIYDYGCYGSQKLHHTTYFTIRSADSGTPDLQVEPWEIGWNYLHGNRAKHGIHQFDQDEGCGNTTGPIRIHHNVVVDQASAGISVGSQCDWSMDVYIENNVLINVGNAADWDGVDPDTSNAAELGAINIRDSGLLGTMYIRNNLVYGWTTDGATVNNRACLSLYGSGSNVSIEWDNNICFTNLDLPFVDATTSAVLGNITGSNNIWHYTGTNSSSAVPPTWDTNRSLDDPLLTITGVQVNVDSNSHVVNNGKTIPSLTRDVYGIARQPGLDIGPVEFALKPKPPSNVTIQ